MMDFAAFIAPMTVDSFLSEYFGHRPVHIEGESPRPRVFSKARLELLMSVLPHWTEDNLKLILNSRPVLGEHFLTGTGARRRADPAKVQLFVGMGASLVGDHIEDVDSDVREITSMLSEQFAATAGANVYCSFKGVRAFNSHCDLHEVFAVQIEGEKVWQIYEHRADAPVEALDGENAQSLIDRAKGQVMMTVRMRPGDLLYIPRGYFHDALADSGASLHLSFAVRPFDGRYTLHLLEELATRDKKFRAYLPDGRREPEALQRHLVDLAEQLATMMVSPLFQTQLANRQRALAARHDGFDLQDQRKPSYYAATGVPGEVAWNLSGATLRHSGGEEPLGPLAEPAEWALGQAAFSDQQLRAQFRWHTDEEARHLIELLTGAGLFAAYEPAL